MFVSDFIQRRLASLLQPWLKDQELQVKLGFFRLNVTLNDVSLDTTALNELLDDPSRICFLEARVERMSLQVSPFSSAAFTLDVRGLHIVLAVGKEEDERGAKWRRKPRDTTVEERNKVLEEIDPEGCALHDAIKRILEITSGTWRTSLVDTVLRHCSLQLHDVHLLLQSPYLPNALSCSLGVKKFSVGSHVVGHKWFVKGLIHSFSVPFEESSFDVEMTGFEIRLNTENHRRYIFPATNMSGLVNFNHLQYKSFSLEFPTLEFLFSPADLSVMFLLYRILSKDHKPSRSGRQLWNIVATKVSSLVPSSNSSLIKVVSTMRLWMRYVDAYQSTLVLVGYPADEAMKRSATFMFLDATYSRSVRHRWKLLSEIEKDLPPEAIAVARRIIRDTVGSRLSKISDSDELLVMKPFLKMWQLLKFILGMIGTLLVVVMKILLLHKILPIIPESSQHLICSPEHFLVEKCVIIKEISIKVSPEIASEHFLRWQNDRDSRIPFHDSFSFDISVNMLFIRYMVHISEQCLMFASGNLEVYSFSSAKAVAGSYLQDHSKKKADEVAVVLYSEPARIIHFPETTDTDSVDYIFGSSSPHLDHLLAKLWLNWKVSSSKSEGEILSNMQAPWILFEIQSSVTDHAISHSSSVVVGKLNINLENDSFTSAIVLLIQMLCALYPNMTRRNVPLQTPDLVDEGSYLRNWAGKFTSYSRKLEMDLVRMLPEKRCQIGAFIAGPHIVFSLLNDQLYPATRSIPPFTKVSLEISDIEIMVTPNLEDPAGSSGDSTEFHRSSACVGLEKLKQIDIPKLDNGSYSCEGQVPLSAFLKAYGFKAYLDETSGDQKLEIATLKPTTIQFSSIRKYYHSLSSSVAAVSAAFHWVLTDFSCLLFLDELYVLSKIIGGILDESSAFSEDGFGGDMGEESFRKVRVHYESEHGETSTVQSRQSSVVTHPQLFLSFVCELKSFDLILQNSRKNYGSATYMMSTTAIGREIGGKPSMHDTNRNGIYTTFQKLLMEFTLDGTNLDAVIDSTGIQCIIFRYMDKLNGASDKSELKHVLCSLNFMNEASLRHGKLCFSLRNIEKAVQSVNLPSTTEESSADGITFHAQGGSPLTANTETSRDHWLFAEICSSEVYMAGCQVKDIILANKHEEYNASFSVGGEFQAITCECKGGSLLLEATAAMMLIECFTLYHRWISELCSSCQSSARIGVAQSLNDMAPLFGHPSVTPQQVQHGRITRALEAFSMNVLHLSLALVEQDESGRLQKLQFEVDSHINLELLNTVRKISISIPRFSVISNFMHGVQQDEGKVVVLDDSLPRSMGTDNFPLLQHKDPTLLDFIDASGTSSSASHVDISISDIGQRNLNTNLQKYILKDLQCLVAVDGPVTRGQSSPACSNHIWAGSGSISGFDMTVSLCEIKMVLSAWEILSHIWSKEGISAVESGQLSHKQGAEGSMEDMIPDGTIVAIQDVDQHMYIAVRSVERGYDITGASHYSLVGERALFRIKYHKLRRWKPYGQVFSLISLYAKDDTGEPLRLSCLQRSRFVDIACSKDSGHALWRMLPFNPGVHEDAIELESSSTLSKRFFHLVNKKNDYAVAFIDGNLEFVSKPGHVFKWKVFHNPGPLGNSLVEEPSNLPNVQGTGTEFLDSNINDMEQLGKNGNVFGITVMIDKITVTIVHEISDTEEKFPLLQGSFSSNQTIIQILDSKFRVMNTSEIILYYFDAQQNSWKELIQPLEICTFYSWKFLVQGAENTSNVASSHFHARVKEMTLLLSERSVDILLFVIGMLDLAGPYAVNSSHVLANCCKIENQSGLTLLCEFYDNQDAAISSRQSTTIFLRHLALDNQPPEASFFSVQLVQQDKFSTSPIRLSLSEARQFAWRTRIVSDQDSKSFPGPVIVVEVSKRIEDGLSINVSPLLKIHNETDFSMDLHFRRPQHDEETDSALLTLKAGEVIDDGVTAFTAIALSGGLKKALTSPSVGNYVLSFRPNIADKFKNLSPSSVEWSDDLKGGKPVRLSGLFDKLSYQVRKAFSLSSVKISMSTANCAIKTEKGFVGNIHFLIQTIGKDVPIVNPDKIGYESVDRNSPVAMQEQREIFLLPTIQVSNSLYTDIHVSLTDKDPHANPLACDNLWSQATISHGSVANFYADPTTIYFVVSLTSFGSICKPVNSSDWVRKLRKQKDDVPHLDIELDFDGGKYFAMLRLSRGPQGTLEAVVFTPYSLQNDTNVPLFCLPANQKILSRGDLERLGTDIPLGSGSILPPNSTASWFLKCHKLCFKLLVEKELEAQLDLDALSGLTEIDLKSEEVYGLKSIMRLGVSLRPALTGKVSSHIVSLNSRYVVCNESKDVITFRQYHMEDMEEIAVNSKERIALMLNTVIPKKKATNIIENLLRKHTKSQHDPSFFIQFRPYGGAFGWSGPVCVASLGRFFLRFRKSLELPESQLASTSRDNFGEFASVHAVEEGSTIVLHFHRPPVSNLPYRIENCLDAPITYYQMEALSEPEILGAGFSVNYAWDDLTLPHKLVIQLDDVHLLREINLDKVRPWKPFYSNKLTRDRGFHLPLEKKPEGQKRSTYSQLIGSRTVKVGFEVYADGVTRVLRICEVSDSRKANKVSSGSHRKLRLRISYFSVHLLEHAKQEVAVEESFDYAPIVITRFEGINWDAIFTNQQKYNQIRVQSLSMDEKWAGASFSAMLRRHQLEKSDANDCILHVAVILLPTSYAVRQVKYLSVILQPLEFNLDEETLMKIVPFWRSSLSDLNTPRQQYYFDHFEIHPIKIVASFLPGDAHYRYSSTQETLRSLLHSVIKIPAIKRKTVELNGVLVTHALITLRELTIKCAQHYSWYSMRAIYIAKGSPLLPPGFASIFDDLASSSLDVFFDPSSGLLNLPGVTLGTLKLISKAIDSKGFSGTKRYFGDMGKTLKTAGSNVLFAAVTEISDSVLKGAEASGFKGMVNGFHQGILKLAMEPSVLSNAFMEGGPDRKIKLERIPGVDELYIEGYLQAMLDTMYKQEYLRVRVVENQVILKNLPPSSSLINEIMDNVKAFLASKSLLKGEPSTRQSLRFIRGEREWRLGPTLMTLCEHLFVSFVIRVLRKQSGNVTSRIKWKERAKAEDGETAREGDVEQSKVVNIVWNKWGIGKFVLSGMVAYIDGRLCRNIPHPLARRIVSGFLLSFLDQSGDGTK